MANIITLTRIILLFVGITFIYVGDFHGKIIAFFIILSVIVMDWLDGYIARRQHNTTSFGAIFDIMGDRIVENCLWIVFAHLHIIPVWIPLVVIVRGFVTDTLRSVALASGRTPFGEKTMMKSLIGRLLVSSRASRALYGAAKVITFCYLILYIAFLEALKTSPALILWKAPAYRTGILLVYITVLFCVVRAIPVIMDSRYYFQK